MTQLEILQLALQTVQRKMDGILLGERRQEYAGQKATLLYLIEKEKTPKPPETFDSLRKAGYV